MPQEDVQEIDDTVPSSETPDVAAGKPAEGAESSPADAVDDSTLSIVRDVIKEARESSDPASSTEGQEEGQGTDPAAPQTEPDNEEYSDVPFAKHPRFRQLLAERKQFKVDADRYQNVQGFMEQHGISPEEAADGFVIMGLMKTDPQAAWEKLKPHVQAILQASGEVLSDDLSELVQAGKMTQEAAFEVSRSRAKVKATEFRSGFAEQREQRRLESSLSDTLRNTAMDWANDRKDKDPRFGEKYPLVMKELKALQFDEGKPTTPEGVKAQLKKAYDAVVLPAAKPTPPPRKQTLQRPPGSGQGSGTAQAKPETTLDIVRANRRQR